MRYIRIYNKIVEHRLSNIPENTYTEKHHIIPKCLGGNNNQDNLVTVTSKEHYILHHLLTKIYPDNKKLARALQQLKTRLNIEKFKNPYSCIRKCEYIAPLHSEETRRKMSLSLTGKKHPMFGKTHSKETKLKMSLVKIGENNPMHGKTSPMYGKNHSEDTKQKISKSLIGKTHSEESKQKMSNIIKNLIWVNNGIINKRVPSDNIPEGFVKGRLKKVHH